MRWAMLAVTVGVFGLVLYGSKKAVDMINEPRGLSLNNPGNIKAGIQWEGMAHDQPDPVFVKFIDPRYGYRAMARILRSYNRRGVSTVREIISTWAPSSENNTEAYISHVARALDIKPEQPVPEKRWPELFEVITLHEQGVQPFSQALIREGISWA